MKSNYQHFVLTASCLKADIWSTAPQQVQGRSALIFWAVTHPDATMPAEPNHIQLATVPARDFWSYFCSWARGAWDKTSICGLNCMFLKSKTCPWLQVWGQVAALWDLPGCTCTESPLAADHAMQQGSSCCLWLPSRHCFGQTPMSWAGVAGTDCADQTICQDSKHDRWV